MNKLYRVSVTIAIHHEGCNTTLQVPTFYYDANLLGLRSEQDAEKLAELTFNQLVPNSAAYACAVEI